jgi:thiamine kinase-like enzyme
MRTARGRKSRDKLGVWENITRWTREAKIVLKELDKLTDTPGYYELLAASKAALAARKASSGDQHIVPLASLAQTVELRSNVNLPLFEQQIKLYRSLVRDWERSEGKSKRVFAHNDTQYGNLLLLTPAKAEDEKALEQKLQAPHQKIIVVDFEYASANPRGFDIGECA